MKTVFSLRISNFHRFWQNISLLSRLLWWLLHYCFSEGRDFFFPFQRSPTIGSPFQFTRINSLVLVGLTMPMNQENSYGQISESRLFFSLERTLKMTLKSFCPKLLKWCTRGTVKNKVRYSFYFLENNEPSFYFLPKNSEIPDF